MWINLGFSLATPHRPAGAMPTQGSAHTASVAELARDMGILDSDLARGNNAAALATAQSAAAVGGLVGGAVLTAWGGPRRKVHGVLMGMIVSSLLGTVVLGLGRVLPVWVVASFLAAGIFLTPFISRREPKHQHVLVYILFGAVAFVVFGSLAAEAASIHGVSWAKGPFFAQQWEYLDLPFFFQFLLTAGLFIWIALFSVLREIFL